MKTIAIGVLLILFNHIVSFSQNIPSGVIHLSELMPQSHEFGSTRTLASGSTRDFVEMNILFISVDPGKKYTLSGEVEKLVIIQSGELTIGKGSNTLKNGSVLICGAGDQNELMNTGKNKLEFYLFAYRSRDESITSDTQFPIIKDWEKMEYKTHDKGGIRNFFNLNTPECHKFEMHVTNLNAGIKSHEPHTHRAGEFVLMVKGHTEMEIDGKNYEANAGDLYFLESEISHAIKNIGDEQCQYFAFQME